jgi:hypothetical protein
VTLQYRNQIASALMGQISIRGLLVLCTEENATQLQCYSCPKCMISIQSQGNIKQTEIQPAKLLTYTIFYVKMKKTKTNNPRLKKTLQLNVTCDPRLVPKYPLQYISIKTIESLVEYKIFRSDIRIESMLIF